MKKTKPSEFGTTFWDRKLLPQLAGTAAKPAGGRQRPVLVQLDPVAGVAPDPRPPVRIYLGTEPAQARAERVFVWSVLQTRDPARAYEIYLMKDLAGFERGVWKTGFTNYRYAVPALAGGQGRAIYNDVDQVYLADPAALFDTDMGGKALLSIDESDTSVMLLDCARLAPLWPLATTQTLHSHRHFREQVKAAGLWGTMAAEWNSRDHEYDPARSKLLHYTILHKQPWQPFPGELRYQENALAEVWLERERAADAAGFTVFTRDRPSQRYRELTAIYADLHRDGQRDQGRPPAKMFAGHSLAEHVPAIGDLARQHAATTILDYGAGKGALYAPHPDHPASSPQRTHPAWPGVTVTCYDPGFPPFAAPFARPFDGVVSTDVVEHIPEEDIPWVLDEMFGAVSRFVYVAAACYPAKKQLADGTNVHCTVQPPAWWQMQMAMAARRHPGIAWTLTTQERSLLALSRRPGLFKPGIRNSVHRGKAA